LNAVPLADLTLLALDGRTSPLSEIVKRTTLLVFLRHLA
jgi:hypothetical protein